MNHKHSADSHPVPRARVAAAVLFYSSCAILSTIISESAVNSVLVPVALLALQTTVQVALLTVIGMYEGWLRLSRPCSVVYTHRSSVEIQCHEMLIAVQVLAWATLILLRVI
ncbi:hypothetical protein BGZ63DRAFT_382621 [Mariannaea sp. PMI_226]|nr:hypothetical protein BGZ63DRAFT_382621 [Mariannaea sp. PMI_226]